ncbi:hypothetical protein [Butyribacter intestini]|uniref:hypothetical protein n=1 Tax=Butyribacter intestini TaxID=1703332 RepID=UPI0022E01164|nr:hypothetical protein [Butyribacter intestini]
MRLTKGTKKALSLALSTALVLTGANVGTLKADAAKVNNKDGVKLTLTGKTLTEKDATVKEDGTVKVTTTFAEAATAGALTGANFGETKTATDVKYVDDCDFSLKIIKVEVAEKNVLAKNVTGDYNDSNSYEVNTTAKSFNDFVAKKGDAITFTYKVTGLEDYEDTLDALKKENEALAASKAALEKNNASLVASKAALEKDNASLVASKAALEKDNKSLAASKAALETENKALAASNSALAASKAALEDQLKNTPAPTETPAPVAKGQMGNFNVSFDYVGDDTWGEQSWGDKSVNVTKDGDYSIEYTATSDSKGIYLMMLDTDLYYGSLADNFALTVKNVKIGDKTYAIDNKGCWGFADQTVSKNYRFNIVNPWNGLFDKTGVNWQDEKVTTIDKLNKAPVKANDKIVVNFNVTTKKASSTVSIKAAKSKVSVAPAKSATVKYTVKGTSTVKATSNNKAVTVKVNKSKKNVTITAKKTAVMGKTATITLKAGSKKSTIKVTVAKTANVKKKKTANYTVALAKVTKKVKAKKIKVSVKNKKVAKVTVKKIAKGQVTFQVKGLKKGKTTATLKYGKKSAKVSVVVK